MAEVNCYNTDEKLHGVLLVFNDGTVLDVKYGKNDEALWLVRAIRKGELFLRIDECDDPDAERYSDTAHFADGLKWCKAATEWEHVK